MARCCSSAGWLWALGALASCQTTDYGEPCAALLDGAAALNPSDDATIVSTAEVVAQSPNFPCASLTCVASAGVGGYCSGECGAGVACPQGFVCRAVEAAGSFAGQTFCTWKPCQQDRDCGPPQQFCCRTVAGADLPVATRLCGYARTGACP